MNMPPVLLLAALLWALLLFGGLAAGAPAPDGSGRIPAWMRLASSATLAAAAWLWLAVDGRTVPAVALIAVGMSLGLAGDFCMTLRPAVSTWHIPMSLGAFGVGHIAYSAAFLAVALAQGVTAGSLLPPWLAWLAVGATGWYLAVCRGNKATAITWAALPYALLLSTTAGLATALALASPPLWPLALGAALFLVSDLILASRVFGCASFPHIQDIIWLTYGPGQALIVYGLHL